jgi:hypothetical protein
MHEEKSGSQFYEKFSQINYQFAHLIEHITQIAKCRRSMS